MVLSSMQLQRVSVTLWFRWLQCLVLRSVLSDFINLRSAECVCVRTMDFVSAHKQKKKKKIQSAKTKLMTVFFVALFLWGHCHCNQLPWTAWYPDFFPKSCSFCYSCCFISRRIFSSLKPSIIKRVQNLHQSSSLAQMLSRTTVPIKLFVGINLGRT